MAIAVSHKTQTEFTYSLKVNQIQKQKMKQQTKENANFINRYYQKKKCHHTSQSTNHCDLGIFIFL